MLRKSLIHIIFKSKCRQCKMTDVPWDYLIVGFVKYSRRDKGNSITLRGLWCQGESVVLVQSFTRLLSLTLSLWLSSLLNLNLTDESGIIVSINSRSRFTRLETTRNDYNWECWLLIWKLIRLVFKILRRVSELK